MSRNKLGQNRINVDVTQALIEAAIRNNSNQCAVARAIAATVPDVCNVTVDIQTIRFSRPADRERLIFLTPWKVQQHIQAFDAGEELSRSIFN